MLNYVKLESIRTLLRIICLSHRKSYLLIICPNSYEKVIQKCNQVKLKLVRILLRFTRLAHRMSYLVIVCSNSHEKLTKGVIRSSWSRFEHCSESLIYPMGSHICSLFAPIHIKVDQKRNQVKLESVRTLLKITRLVYMKSYLAIIGPNSHGKLTKYKIRPSYYLFYLPIFAPQMSIFSLTYLQYHYT